METDYRKNIPILYIYSILIKKPVMPILILYFLLHNLSYTQIGILSGTWVGLTVITEIHGGIFADKHGKKSSLLLHAVFGALALFFYYIGSSFWHFMIGSVMLGIAGAFITGTRNALLYDTLNELDETEKFKKYNGRILLYSHIVNAFVLLAIPPIYEINVKLPFLIGIAFFLAAILLSSILKEPSKTERTKEQTGYKTRFLESLKEIKLTHAAVVPIAFMIITKGFEWMASDYIQPLLKITGMDVVYFGLVYFGMRIAMGVGAEIIHRIDTHVKFTPMITTGLLLIILSFLAVTTDYLWLVVAGIILLKFAEGYNRNILEDKLNQSIKSKNRTTILSITSMSSSLFMALLFVSFGAVADLVGVKPMFYYAIAALILAVLATIAYLKYRD